MKELAIEILVGLAILAAIAIGGYSYGVHTTNNAWQARQAKAERAAHETYRAEVARGDQAATAYLQQLADQEDRYEKLDDQFKALRKRVPLVVPARMAAAPASAGATAPPAADDVDPARGLQPPDASGNALVLHLTAGAVWMWNSALAGRDMPAGACDAAAAAGAAQAACAQDTGLDLDDAWANQQANARSCAADRKRFTDLIEYLKGRTR